MREPGCCEESAIRLNAVEPISAENLTGEHAGALDLVWLCPCLDYVGLIPRSIPRPPDVDTRAWEETNHIHSMSMKTPVVGGGAFCRCYM